MPTRDHFISQYEFSTGASSCGHRVPLRYFLKRNYFFDHYHSTDQNRSERVQVYDHPPSLSLLNFLKEKTNKQIEIRI